MANRAPPAQPHGAGRRHRAGDRRQLVRRRPRRPQQRRVRGRAVEPRHRHVEDAGRRAGHPPVPLDGAAAARRARAVRRRRDLRHLRPVGYLAKNAEVFTPAVPVQTDAPARSPPGRRSPRRPGVAYGAASRSPRPTPPRSARSALVRLGAVTHSVDMEQRYVPLSFTAGAGTLTATAPQRQHRPARRLHAVRRRRHRRPVGGQDGHLGVAAPPPPPPNVPPDRHASPPPWTAPRSRRRAHRHRGGRRRRRDRRACRVPPQRRRGRPGHDLAVLVGLEERDPRHPHTHRARDRQRGRRDHEPGPSASPSTPRPSSVRRRRPRPRVAAAPRGTPPRARRS